jgi:membrane-bound lytic murein transglycosylase B
MTKDHRQEALEALSHFREEVRAAGFPKHELEEILGHVEALEIEVASPAPSPEKVTPAREFLEDVTHTPAMTNAIAKVVQFFNSIGL